jgi:hypothetical protein
MLGSAAEARRTIAPGEQQTAEIQVPAGSDAVWARVRAGAAGADLDLYLFDCTGKTCEPRGKSIRVDSDEWVKAPNPAAGRWLVVIDAHVASGPVEYDYIDVITNPRFGAVHAADVPAERGAGATWTTAASAWVASPPPAPRRPYALVPVVSSGAKTIVRVGATELRPPAVLGFVELSPGQVAKPTLAEGRDAAR